jgi:archaellum biogenesis ATPase FlaH
MFSYLPGQTCTFNIGKVTLGTLKNIPSDGKVTPQDVAGVVRTATGVPTAVAIAQFLQTLNDGSTAGKIVIPTATTTAFNASTVTPVTLAAPSGAISQSDLSNLVTDSR